MVKLIDLVNTPEGKRIIMESFLPGGRKLCEQDISDMTCQEVKEAISMQEAQGRSWTYKTVYKSTPHTS